MNHPNCVIPASYLQNRENHDSLNLSPVYVDKDCTCYCQTCNNYVNLNKAGDRIPPCCGKLMELLD